MEEIFCERVNALKKERERIEKEMGVEILIKGKKAIVSGPPVKEFETISVIEALTLGFPLKSALTLKNEDIIFKKIHIRHFTRRKNLHEVISRLVGTEGKTKRTIQEISGCEVVISGNEVGIIGSSIEIEATIVAISNIIKGTKQANAYKYLERMNTLRKKKEDQTQ